MGDSQRFRLFASLISELYPDRSRRIADVAAGKGYLKAALYQQGYRRITCWDRRHKLAKGRPGQKYQLFNYRTAPREYNLVLGMHPDEATDQIIMYAVKHRVPFIVCPCCTKPTATEYTGRNDYSSWMQHLVSVAQDQRMSVRRILLPMAGRNIVLVGTPK